MNAHQYLIKCERGYDPSAVIISTLNKAKYPSELHNAYSTHFLYETTRKLTKRITKKIESIIGVRNVTELTDLV
jgi:hypothetical protein